MTSYVSFKNRKKFKVHNQVGVTAWHLTGFSSKRLTELHFLCLGHFTTCFVEFMTDLIRRVGPFWFLIRVIKKSKQTNPT